MRLVRESALIRLITRDDECQADAVEHLVNAKTTPNSKAYIDRIVIVETVWVLQNHYRYKRQQIAECLHKLLTANALKLEDEPRILDALDLYLNTSADFSDLMIMIGSIEADATPLYTFDRKLSSLTHCERL